MPLDDALDKYMQFGRHRIPEEEGETTVSNVDLVAQNDQSLAALQRMMGGVR